MMSSRGMGAMRSSKMPKGVRKERMDNTDFTEYANGGLAQQAATAIAMKEAGKKPKGMAAGGSLKEVDSEKNPGLAKLPTPVRNKMGYLKSGGPAGLYANIHAKQARIAAGSKEKMRKPGSKGAPTKQAFINSAKTAKK